jgi:hypothetical protein
MYRKLFEDFIKYWECGQVKVLGRISGVVTLCLVTVTYLQLKHISLFWWQLVLLGIVLVILILISGFIYSKLGLYSLEQSSFQKANPEMQKLRTDVMHCIKLLEKK